MGPAPTSPGRCHSDEWLFPPVPSGPSSKSAQTHWRGRRGDGPPSRSLRPTAPPIRLAALAICSRLQGDWYVRFLSCAWQTHMRAPRQHSCMAWHSKQFNGLGACHGLEVGFVFDTLGKGQSLERTRRKFLPMRCTPPGSALPPAGIPGGRSTNSGGAAMRFDSTSRSCSTLGLETDSLGRVALSCSTSAADADRARWHPR